MGESVIAILTNLEINFNDVLDKESVEAKLGNIT